MFERYNEPGRRTIFYAREAASRLGGDQIGAEHLLLGLLQNTATVHRFLSAGAPDAIRAKIEAECTRNPKLATSVDLAVSNECKRAMAYAAEESERLAHTHIGPEHLLLGLLREPDQYAAKLLAEHGLEAATLRLELAKAVPERQGPGAHLVTLHGTSWPVSVVRDKARAVQKFLWQRRRWRPRDFVVQRSDGLVSFDLTLADDASRFELKPRQWTADGCVICGWQFSEYGGEERIWAHWNGRDWLCSECMRFVAESGNP